MSRATKGMNRHQKAAFRPGEHRVRGDEIERLLELAQSDDPEDRLEAASNLCPCHLRRRIDEAWQALYRMMEDPDVRVRRAAWHTLEDGGCPTDPALEPIFERALQSEDDRQVRHFVDMFARPWLRQKEQRTLILATQDRYPLREKCDFCARGPVPVRADFDTEIGAGASARFARVCEQCDH
ncbi:MAG: HEAT repeat domain-containing protein [Caldilineaceae bacterium]|nr:HEAT repeat domain-containing protein [Caldilineaceae bacterium]